MEQYNEKMGKTAMERLHRTTSAARQIQQTQLRDILRENRETAYGTRYGFGEIHSLEEFQSRVPLSVYDDYQPYIDRLIDGEMGQLTREDPVYYAITSGSTDEPKYVPVTETDMRIHYDCIYMGVMGMVQEHYPDADPKELFGRIFQVGEFMKTCLPGGQMSGVRSASLYQWLDRDGGFDASAYCVPKEVLFPKEVEDLTYVKIRFALADSGITGIHGVFLHRVVSVMDYIRQNWELLLHDMETGTVDERIPLGEAWRKRLEIWLPADPARASELRALHLDENPEHMLQKLWPKVKYIVAVGGRKFPVYTQAMERYGGGVPIHHFIYGASEGFISIAAGVDKPDQYILLPEAGFFEFLPADGSSERPLTVGDLAVGKRYELILTNHSGLYRYRMRDVLEVVDFCGQAPVIRFCYRINQVLNVADEKLNMEQLQEAFRLYEERTNCHVTGFCAQEDFSGHFGRYLIYIEGEPADGASEQMDECLREISVAYRMCRNMSDIGQARVRFLPAGSFKRYEDQLASKGTTMAQYKPIQILNNKEKQRFFAEEARRLEREAEL